MRKPWLHWYVVPLHSTSPNEVRIVSIYCITVNESSQLTLECKTWPLGLLLLGVGLLIDVNCEFSTCIKWHDWQLGKMQSLEPKNFCKGHKCKKPDSLELFSWTLKFQVKYSPVSRGFSWPTVFCVVGLCCVLCYVFGILDDIIYHKILNSVKFLGMRFSKVSKTTSRVLISDTAWFVDTSMDWE